MSGAPSKRNSKAPTQRTVLVVDDDSAIRTMIVRALSSRFRVEQAADGLEALEILGRVEPPSLILLDVMMPRIDGISVAKKIKTEPKLRHIPVIFLTAKSAPGDVVAGIQSGAKAYLTKPFAITDLLLKVEQFAK
jgi:CheY-like chemotaxis protein